MNCVILFDISKPKRSNKPKGKVKRRPRQRNENCLLLGRFSTHEDNFLHLIENQVYE